MSLSDTHIETLSALAEAQAGSPFVTSRLLADCSPALTAAERNQALGELTAGGFIARRGGLTLTSAGRRLVRRL